MLFTCHDTSPFLGLPLLNPEAFFSLSPSAFCSVFLKYLHCFSLTAVNKTQNVLSLTLYRESSSPSSDRNLTFTHKAWTWSHHGPVLLVNGSFFPVLFKSWPLLFSNNMDISSICKAQVHPGNRVISVLHWSYFVAVDIGKKVLESLGFVGLNSLIIPKELF